MQRARRLYLYFVSAISLIALGTGLARLLTNLFERISDALRGTAIVSGDTEAFRREASLVIASIVVSLPSWLLHWWLSERSTGGDSAHKLAILASMAFNSRVTLDDVYTEGIEGITPDDIAFGGAMGYVIKLLAVAKNEAEGISVRVHPTMIPRDHPLAAVRDENNAIFVSGDAVGELMFYGKGAGSLPAASAVVGDVISIARNILSGGRMVGCTCFYDKPIKDMADVVCRYFMIFDVPDRPGVLAEVTGVLGRNQISIASVIQHEPSEEDGGQSIVPLVIMTAQATEGATQKAMAEIGKLSSVRPNAVRMRVLD